MKQTLLDYYRHHLNQFASNLEDARAGLDEAAIHQYRVSIKRIMSVSRACKKVCSKSVFEEDQLVTIKKTFKAGGSIRDQQIQLGIINETAHKKGLEFPMVIEEIQQSIEKQKKYFMLATAQHDPRFVEHLVISIEAKVDGMDDESLRKGMHDWIKTAFRKLRKKKDQVSTAEELHNYRTRFKQAAYLLEMIQESRYEEERVPRFTYTRLKNFGQELGDWHDHYMLLQRLSAILHETGDESLRSECRILTSIVAPVQKAYFDDVLAELKNGRIFDEL